MTTAFLISNSPLITDGASDVAQYVAQKRAGERQSLLQNSCYFGFEFKSVQKELYAAAEECKSPDWDGQGACPVSVESYSAAYRFLEALPIGFEPPSVGVEPDGEMTLEWYRSPRRTLSISFSKDGEIHYAALLGASKAYGTEIFFGDVPKTIVDLVTRTTVS